MVILAWLVIILFLLFGAGPVVAILCSRDAFITYTEAVGLGFAIMLGIVAVVGAAAIMYWAIGVVSGYA